MATDITLPSLLSAGSQASIDVYVSALKAAGQTDAALALDKLSRAITRLENAMRTSQTVSIPTSSSGATPPSDVSAVSVSGSFDPVTGYGTITVGVTPPGAPFVGCHLFIEIPDQSANPAFTVGSSDLSGTAAIGGDWSPVDLGMQPYVAAQQPWTISFPIPAGLDLTQNIPCRIYAVSYSTEVENALVQFGQPGASPSQSFVLTRQSAPAPASGSSITQNTGPIVATVLTADNTTGKLKTPVYVIVSSAPSTISGWVGQLVLTYGSADPTVAANQFPVGPIFTTAGPVNAGHDGIAVPHSFAVDTPASIQNATVWARTGKVDANGNYQWNNLVPGVTPSFPITLGTTTGTTDAGSVMLATIQASMAVVAGQFGVATGGITNPLLGALAVDAGKLANSAVTAAKIANLAVGTAAIQLLAVNNSLIANATITSAQIAAATIVGANIASATIVDANIATVNASKITAGTISATISITAPTINGGTINQTNAGSSYTTTINNADYIIADSGINKYVLSIQSGEPTVSLTTGTGLSIRNAALTSNDITFSGIGGHSIRINGTGGVIVIDGNTGFTGTLAAAISAGKNVIGGIIY